MVINYIGGWGVSPTGKSQWFLHACDPVAGVETENSPPRAQARAWACPWVRSLTFCTMK